MYYVHFACVKHLEHSIIKSIEPKKPSGDMTLLYRPVCPTPGHRDHITNVRTVSSKVRFQ